MLPESVLEKAAAEMLEAAQPKPKPIPVVDTHLHLWDLKRFRLPWVQKGSPLARSFVMKDFLTAVDGLNVTKAVYMEVDVEVGQQRAEAEYVFEICRQDNTPLKAAVISGRPANDDFSKYLEGFKRSPYLKGVRQVLHNDGTLTLTSKDSSGNVIDKTTQPATVQASGANASKAALDAFLTKSGIDPNSVRNDHTINPPPDYGQ